jgi:hypothetical protein
LACLAGLATCVPDGSDVAPLISNDVLHQLIRKASTRRSRISGAWRNAAEFAVLDGKPICGMNA